MRSYSDMVRLGNTPVAGVEAGAAEPRSALEAVEAHADRDKGEVMMICGICAESEVAREVAVVSVIEEGQDATATLRDPSSHTVHGEQAAMIDRGQVYGSVSAPAHAHPAHPSAQVLSQAGTAGSGVGGVGLGLSLGLGRLASSVGSSSSSGGSVNDYPETTGVEAMAASEDRRVVGVEHVEQASSPLGLSDSSSSPSPSPVNDPAQPVAIPSAGPSSNFSSDSNSSVHPPSQAPFHPSSMSPALPRSLPAMATRPWTTSTNAKTTPSASAYTAHPAPSVSGGKGHRAAYDAAKAADKPYQPLLDITSERVSNTGKGALYAGSVFRGTQTSGRSAYDVEIRFLVRFAL
jgi:hypothetical protein